MSGSRFAFNGLFGVFTRILAVKVTVLARAMYLSAIWFIAANSLGYGQTVIYVDQSATGPVHDGLSWCSAYLRLQDALTIATPLTTVRVADGSYKPDQGAVQTPGDRFATFQISDGVDLRGGYAGCGESDPDARDVVQHETVLSGDLAANDGPSFTNYEENSDHIVIIQSAGASTRIDGFTIRGGNAADTGGGMLVISSTPTIAGCLFSKNFALNSGGGLEIYNASPTILDSVFEDNQSHQGGGVLSGGLSWPVAERCIFRRNVAIGGSSFNRGGGGWSGRGGGGHGTVIACLFEDNHADRGGGMANQYTNSPRVENCVFRNNSADICGGAIVNYDRSGSVYVNCTIVNNYAPGGAAAGICNTSSTPTILNSILWGNQNSNGSSESAQASGSSSVFWSLIQNISTFAGGTGNLGGDPQFVDGPSGNFRLLGGSPCIDVGNNDVVTDATDLDGNPRIIDGNADATATVDMGAYEVQAQDPCGNGDPATCDDDNICTDDSCSLSVGCVHMNNTNSCDDGLYCTVEDICGNGSCSGQLRDCSAFANQCNIGVCDEDADTCEAQPLQDGTLCDDGLNCTLQDVCTNGVCGGVGVPAPNFALEFDGTGDMVVVPDSPELRGLPGQSVTIEAWIWVENPGVMQTFISKFQNGCSKDWGISYWDNAALGFETEHDCNNYYFLSGVIQPQTWTHVAVSFDGNLNRTSLYVDGDFVGITGSNPLFYTTANVLFGRRYIDGPTAFPFRGKLDEIRIWSVARSEVELQATMYQPLSGAEIGLIGYWPLEEGGGQITIDRSGHGHDGILGSDANTTGDVFDPTWIVSTAPLIYGRGNSFDCNGNGRLDACDIEVGTSLDCNANGIPDECDIASGVSFDCNSNGIADECDLASGSSADCNTNSIPDECEIGGAPSIAGLTLWLLAGSGVSIDAQGVTLWADQSGNGHNFTPISNSGKPALVPSALNGHPVVRFDGSDDRVDNIDGLISGNQFTIFTVMSVVSGNYPWEIGSGSPGARVFYERGTHGGASPDALDIGHDYGTDVRASYPGISAPGFRALSIVGDQMLSGTRVYVDGAAATTTLAGSDQNWTIGAGGNRLGGGASFPNAFTAVDVSEVLVYDRILTQQEREGVERYLGHKYFNANGSSDCNDNGVPDECDIGDGTSQDQNGNGVPDECDPLAIPTVSEWGLTILALTGLIAGSLLFRERKGPLIG